MHYPLSPLPQSLAQTEAEGHLKQVSQVEGHNAGSHAPGSPQAAAGALLQQDASHGGVHDAHHGASVRQPGPQGLGGALLLWAACSEFVSGFGGWLVDWWTVRCSSLVCPGHRDNQPGGRVMMLNLIPGTLDCLLAAYVPL